MQRRKFLATVGSLAAGSAAAIGTGAVTSMSADRSADIAVVNDDSGIIALEDKTESDVVRLNSDGELEIDFSQGDGDGVNVNSIYKVGKDQPHQGQAFRVLNQDTIEHDITLKYEADTAGQTTGSQLTFRMNTGEFPNQSSVKTLIVGNGHASGGVADVDWTVDSGEFINVMIKVNTTNGETADDLSGTLTVSAN